MAVASFPSEELHLETTPTRFRKILVPLNLAAPSIPALDTAIQIARLYDSEVLVAYAASLSTYSTGQGFIANEFLVDKVNDSRKRLEEMIAHRPNSRPLRIHAIVELGNAVTMIRQLTEAYTPDLIVMGSHGSSAVEQFALGSVAQSVIYALTTPVLVMGPDAHPSELPFRSVLLATDLSTLGLRAAQYASSLSESFVSCLTLMHVIENVPKEKAVRQSLEDSVRSELAMLVPSNANLSAHPSVRFGDAAEQILNVAELTDASLIVLAAKHQSVVADHAPWGTLSRVIHGARCGVLVIRGHLV